MKATSTKKGYKRSQSSLKLLAVFFISVCLTSGCSGGEDTADPEMDGNESDMAVSLKTRNFNPVAEEDDLLSLAHGNTAFSFDLYEMLIDDKAGNLFYSPHSIRMALAMAWAGASGETETQMADVLCYSLPQDIFHPALNALDLKLTERATGAAAFRLNIVNAIWGQTGYSFEQNFLNIIAENYGTGLNLLDFVRQPEASRLTINQWVEDQTEEKITDLFQEGSIDNDTRLVLTNAIYFKADWKQPFKKSSTLKGDFKLLNGDRIDVPKMNNESFYLYMKGLNFQAVEMPYRGDAVSMIVIMPSEGDFEKFENAMDETLLEDIAANTSPVAMHLSLPKFSFDFNLVMNETLRKMGMVHPFSEGGADFSGIDGTSDLFISQVVHKAYVAVDEEGTEAAAATGADMKITSYTSPPVKVDICHPFIFLICDKETETILFIGRMLDPRP